MQDEQSSFAFNLIKLTTLTPMVTRFASRSLVTSNTCKHHHRQRRTFGALLEQPPESTDGEGCDRVRRCFSVLFDFDVFTKADGCWDLQMLTHPLRPS
jgi:hypothetical protein